MDQYLNNRQNEILYSLLANPADAGQLYASNLQTLINEFPQSGLLHALLAHATGEQHISTAATYFNNKALFKLINSPYELAEIPGQQIIGHANNLNGKQDIVAEDNLLPADEDLIAATEQATHAEHFFGEEPEVNTSIDENAQLNDIVETDQSDNAASQDNNALYPVDEIYDEIAPLQTSGYFNAEINTGIADDVQLDNVAGSDPEISSREVNKESEPVAEITEESIPVMQDTGHGNYFNGEPETGIQPQDEEELKPVAEEEPDLVEAQPEDDQVEEPFILIDDYQKDEQNIQEHSAPVFTIDEQEPITSVDIDDEVFDEITAIEDIRFSEKQEIAEASPLPLEIAINNEEAVEDEGANKASEESVPKDRPLDLNDEAEKLIIGNIAATDYFVFDRAISERKQNEIAENGLTAMPAETEKEISETVSPAPETYDLSKYHDEKMPYTFMWWLDKTRKEHAGMYQPYLSNNTRTVATTKPDELQQQYFENIFHLNSVEELDRSTSSQTIEFDMDRKEDIIIQRFIVEEPHIKPPSNDKLDNENKAKKSAEDQDELVTETLARIYTDQMLYHKAINTYKKLVLKFPEKSRYFADQIEQLQRKIN